MTETRIRTPLGRVRHLGAAHSGPDHFWRQRLTGAANVPLTIGFVILVISVAGRPYADVTAILASPLAALVLVLMMLSIAIHMRIGMQTVIEDYVHSEGLKIVLLVANTFFAFAVAAVTIFAVLKLAFGG